ncbi:MAG: GNAT family N-acetyltransferase [Bacteriovoracaceae bacterium]|nr:GNAT family N-acetyltransferase [Bacteriovoracaceae bacterium]
MESKLTFKQSKSGKDIVDTYNFNVEVFAESKDFGWSLEEIKKEIKKGWKLYSANYDGHVIAAIYLRIQDGVLYTKNTPIRIDYQGKGFSHQIKDYVEDFAKKNKLKKIINFCPIDSFRLISLNERHGYKKTGNKIGDNKFLEEWEKKIS